MRYAKYESFEELPEVGPALLHYSPFADLGDATPRYWLPMMNRKVLCIRGVDRETGSEVYVHRGVPYEDLAQRWLEEALADLGPTGIFVSSLEINESFERLSLAKGLL